MMRRGTFTLLAGGALAALTARAFTSRAAQSGRYEVTLDDATWRKRLGPDRYQILRQNGTEPPGSSPLLSEHRTGEYACAGCALALFTSRTKYDSGDGWPAFWDHEPNAVRTRSDYELVMPRTEVHCRRCGGHLGHIFNDGPRPTGLRYCIDGLALRFQPKA
jgi:peptide-methionine (R)-S-oxide reductase